MRGGNHGKVKIECSVDPLIADALAMLRAVHDGKDNVYRHRLRLYIAECIETYVPDLFRKTFGITIVEFRKAYPRPVRKRLPVIARELIERKESQDAFYRSNFASRRCAAQANA